MTEPPEPGSEPQTEVPEWRRTRVVIPEEDLTLDLMRTIIGTYYESTGAGERTINDIDMEMYWQDTLDSLGRIGWAEWRFGSRLSPHSKLWIQRTSGAGSELEVFVDPNMDDRQDDQEQLRKDFQEALMAVLKD